jgi:hypothetical protein
MFFSCGHPKWGEHNESLSEEINMKKLIYFVTGVTLLFCAGFTQTPPVAQPGSNVPPVLPAATPLGAGPFKAIMEVDPTLAKHTVYRPDDMRAVGSAKLPIMAWGNGACSANGNSFRVFLAEIASHGYLIIASGPNRLWAAAVNLTAKFTAAKPAGSCRHQVARIYQMGTVR